MPGVKPRTKALKSEQISGVLQGELATYEKVGLFQRALNKKTAYRYRGALLQYQKALQGNNPSLENSRRFLGHLRENEFKPSTLRLYRSALQGFHIWRGEKLVFPIKVPHHQPPYHSIEKINRILSYAIDNPRDHVILRLQSDAGLRRSEVESLRVQKVDLVGRMLHIRGKGDKDRTIPLTRELYGALELFSCDKKPSDFVVDLKSKGIYGVVKKYARLAGEPDFHPHDLRHAFATRLVEGGANIRAVQELLGHTDLTTTSVYLGLAPKHLEEAIKVLEKRDDKAYLSEQSGKKIMKSPHSFKTDDPMVAALKVILDPDNLEQVIGKEPVEEIKLNKSMILSKTAMNPHPKKI